MRPERHTSRGARLLIGIPIVLLAAAILSPPSAAVVAWIVFCLGALAWVVFQWPKIREERGREGSGSGDPA